MPKTVRSLFVLHVGSNAGYAIAPLEQLFFDVGRELAAGDPSQVHFAYADLEKGPPRTLPADFRHVVALDFHRTDALNMAQFTAYAAQHSIDLALFFDLQPVHPVVRALRRAGTRTVVAYWGATISSPMPTWKLALKRLEVALSRSKVDGLIFESRAMADLAVRGRGVPERMIDVVPLGVDTARFRPAPSDYVHRTLGFPPERRVIVYAGHMEPRKGVHVLVEAAIELLARRGRRDVCFLICGNRPGESEPFEQMYAGLGINDWIRFGGYRQDLPDIYPSCFCGVIPSVGWDSFTYGAVEMAAAGLPVVASRFQGLAEAVLDGETGLLFESGNAQALAGAIEKLLDNPQLAAELGSRGRLRCETELSLQTQRQRFLAVLQKRLRQTNP